MAYILTTKNDNTVDAFPKVRQLCNCKGIVYEKWKCSQSEHLASMNNQNGRQYTTCKCSLM